MITKNASLSLCFDGCCFLLLLSYNRRFFKSLFFRSTCSLTWRRRLVAHTCTVPSTHSTEKQYYLAGLKMSMCERWSLLFDVGCVSLSIFCFYATVDVVFIFVRRRTSVSGGPVSHGTTARVVPENLTSARARVGAFIVKCVNKLIK